MSEDVEDLTVLLGESLREKAVTRWKSAARVGVERKRAKTSRDAYGGQRQVEAAPPMTPSAARRGAMTYSYKSLTTSY